MFRISLGMIVRNEGRTLAKCLASVAPHVDEIVIGLGGESTDNTEAIIRDFQQQGTRITVILLKWTDDFAAARNQVMEKVTGDYFFWLDGDDELVGGEHLRELIATYPNVDAFFMGYNYARDQKGHTVTYLVRERLIRLHDQLPHRGWLWVGKVHEVLIQQDFEPNMMQIDNVVVVHNKPANKHSPDRNLKILYSQLKEQEPNPDPRILGYLCTEQMQRSNFSEAIVHGQRFIQLSGWREEKYQMQHRISDMYRMMGNLPAALESDILAMQICPEWPDAWLGMAETYIGLKNYQAAIEVMKAAETKAPPQTMLIINPLDYSYEPFILMATAYAQLGDNAAALDNYMAAYRVQQSKEVADQIALLRDSVHLGEVVQSVLLLREQLGRNDEWLKARKLFDVIPKYVEHDPRIMDAWERTMVQTEHIVHPEVMVDFYINNPHWTPISDELLNSEGWKNHPRLRFAITTAQRLGAKTVVDWGCSDGFITLPIAKETGARVTGFDLDPRCIDLATLRADQWGVQARFQEGNIEEIGGWEGDKADLAVFFEVIEHVVDPALTLERLEKTAKHIAITTPFLAWERDGIASWDRVEPKGHLRIFDTYDLERIIAPRGRIHNLYRQPFGDKAWIFADYEPGATADKTVIIGAMGAPEGWNPKSFESGGLGGSETAVIKLANAFTGQGHQAIVYSTINEPGYYNGVCYRPTEHFRPEIKSDLFIAWRNPTAADWAIDTKCLVLWMHDVDAGDALTPERARRFNAIVVLTEWHKGHMMKRYPFLKDEQFVIIGNGVDKSRFSGRVRRNPKKVIYSSSPDRGLDVIVKEIWPRVLKEVPDAELHTYYGWNNFDKAAGNRQDVLAFKYDIFSAIANSNNVTQHGRVNQDELAKAFMESSVWLYPTYFTETYCISAVEAQLAGAIPITNQLAALEETVRSGIIIPGDVRTEPVYEKYAQAVIQALKTPLAERTKLHAKVKKHAPAVSWEEIGQAWSSRFLRS